MEKRIYFGKPVGYVEDSMHAVVTKDVYPFYFELKNNTQYELCITTFPCMDLGTLKPKERKRIECYSACQREITAFIKGSLLKSDLLKVLIATINPIVVIYSPLNRKTVFLYGLLLIMSANYD